MRITEGAGGGSGGGGTGFGVISNYGLSQLYRRNSTEGVSTYGFF